MTAHHTDQLIKATVSIEWLRHFVGHLVWVRPPNKKADYYRISGVVIDETGRRQMIVNADGVDVYALCAQMVQVVNIPVDQCHMVNVQGYEWWEWTVPDHEPPEWPHERTATVTAHVPEEWLPRFIGHKVETHLPVVRGSVDGYTHRKLVDVFEINYELAHPGHRFFHLVVETEIGLSAMGTLSWPFVEDVPKHECENRDGKYWWKPPADQEPPAVEIRPRTWTPTNTQTTASGDQTLLF